MHHGPDTKTAIRYIRHSTQGDISLANTGPFVRELNGRIHTFVHNGNLRCSDNFRTHAGNRFLPVGETDSELAWRFANCWKNSSHYPAMQEHWQRWIQESKRWRI